MRTPAALFGAFAVPSGSGEREIEIVLLSKSMSPQRRPRTSPRRSPANGASPSVASHRSVVAAATSFSMGCRVRTAIFLALRCLGRSEGASPSIGFRVMIPRRRASTRVPFTLDGAARPPGVGEIGEQLFISEATVKTHVTHILQKLDLRDRVQAVVLCA